MRVGVKVFWPPTLSAEKADRMGHEVAGVKESLYLSVQE